MTTASVDVQAKPQGSTGAIRLLLGGRDTKIDGWLNVDLYDGPNVDIRADVSDLKIFKENSVSEIYASHILEHFPHPKTSMVLREWARVLKNGGKAYIAVPDFDAAVKLYLENGLGEFIRNLLWGDQGYDLAFHYAGFTYPTLAALLCRSGFLDVRRITWMPYRIEDCSRLVDTKSLKPISLTVEATK